MHFAGKIFLQDVNPECTFVLFIYVYIQLLLSKTSHSLKGNTIAGRKLQWRSTGSMFKLLRDQSLRSFLTVYLKSNCSRYIPSINFVKLLSIIYSWCLIFFKRFDLNNLSIDLIDFTKKKEIFD